jgi:hypothetical protein
MLKLQLADIALQGFELALERLSLIDRRAKRTP